MKVLVLNGSPRKNGTIAKLLHETTKDIECEFIDVNELNFDYCRGCMSCRSKNNCCLKNDDAHSIAEKIREAQVLVIGSPCWWGNINGKMKMLFDRMVYALMGESKSGIPVPLNKGKKCVIVTSCTTPWPFNILARQSSGTVREIKEIMNYSGFRCIGTIQKGGTKMNREISEHEKRKCARINKKIKEHAN